MGSVWRQYQKQNDEDLEIESRIEYGFRKVRGKITKFEGIQIQSYINETKSCFLSSDKNNE